MANHLTRWKDQLMLHVLAPTLRKYSKPAAALMVAGLLLSMLPSGVFGRIDATAAATIVGSSFTGQTEPLLDCGANSPYGYPCNPGLQWQDKDVGQPAALLVRGLQDGDRISIHNISGSVSWGEGTATCENGDPSNAGTPKLVGIVQFVNANGRVVHVPGRGVHNTNALYLKDLEGQGIDVPQGAVRMYGSFPDSRYNDNRGSCSFTIHVTSAGGGSSSSSMNSSNSSSSVSSSSDIADLSITKTADRTTAIIGQNVTYTLTVHNNGPATAENVVSADNLPAGITYISSSATQGSYNGHVWMIGTLANGQTVSLSVVAEVTQAGQITNTATLTSTNIDNNGSNNQSSTTITGVNGGGSSSSVSSSSSSASSQPSTNADLSVFKTADKSVANVGDNVVFTITVHNNGPADAQNVIVNDELPAGLSFVSSLTTQGTYNNGVWTVGTVQNGQSAIMNIVAQVVGTGNITNSATVNSNNPDNNAGNNTGSITITGVPVVSSSSSSASSTSSSISSAASSQSSSATGNVGCIQILKEAFNPAGGLMSPVPQFTFTLDNGPTVQSDASGHARFDNVTPGYHTITETVPQGWNQFLVTPQGGQVYVSAGGMCAGIAFKNQQIFVVSSSSSSSSMSSSSSLPPPISSSSSSSSSTPPLLGCINVQKQAFNPAGFGISPVPQFLFTLDGTQTAINDASGNAFFGNVTPGTHTITENVPSGWTQVQSPGTITVQSGMSCANAVFKNQQIAPPGSSSSSMSSVIIPSSSSSSMSSQTPIVGCVSILKETFDASGNPLNPVAPFQFQIDNGPLVTNDGNGYARFDNVPAGMHTITEIPQSGWNQILVTPQNGQLNVPASSLCAGILFKNQQTGGGQNVVIGNNSNTSVNSTINAVSGNSTTINQNGNGDQNAAVGNGANTSVDSTINAVSGNNTNVTQNGDNWNGQTVIDLNNGNTGVNSQINAASGNQTAVNQNDTGGNGNQNAGVMNGANTNVDSTINALSGNATNIAQNDNGANAAAPLQLTPLFATAPQAQAQSPTGPSNTMTVTQQQNLLSSILSMLNALQQQLANMFGSH